MYLEAVELMEDEGKESMALDIFRQAIGSLFSHVFPHFTLLFPHLFPHFSIPHAAIHPSIHAFVCLFVQGTGTFLCTRIRYVQS